MSIVAALEIKLSIPQNVMAQLHPDDLSRALWRHRTGAHGEESQEIRESNRKARVNRQQLRSLYTDRNGLRFWIITEADGSTTQVTLI